MLIIRNLNLISVQSWTYLDVGGEFIFESNFSLNILPHLSR